eukprot:2993466-Rhodomonas_salina.2
MTDPTAFCFAAVVFVGKMYIFFLETSSHGHGHDGHCGGHCGGHLIPQRQSLQSQHASGEITNSSFLVSSRTEKAFIDGVPYFSDRKPGTPESPVCRRTSCGVLPIRPRAKNQQRLVPKVHGLQATASKSELCIQCLPRGTVISFCDSELL